MDVKKLLNLIKKEEGPKLDFKQRLELDIESGRKELAKDICAIANSRGGRGYLVIGIEDKTKKVVGILENEIKEEKIQQIISSRIEPPVPIQVDFVHYGDKTVAIINIYDAPQKPYQLRENGAFYIRRGSTTDTMRKDEIVSALEENLNLNLELCPVVKSDINCLDVSIVDKYFNGQGIYVNDENRTAFMENTSIIHFDRDIDKYVVTVGGMLIFSKVNNIYLPHNMIKIINKVNKNYDDNIIIQGDLLTMIDIAEQKLKLLLPQLYPIEAIYEGIKNAVLYRDYGNFYKIIEVIVTESSISILSPGALMKGKDVNNSNYLKRNMWIYEKLIALDDKKRFSKSGRGFTKMQKAFKNKGRVNFANCLSDDSFKVIYPGTKKFK